MDNFANDLIKTVKENPNLPVKFMTYYEVVGED